MSGYNIYVGKVWIVSAAALLVAFAAGALWNGHRHDAKLAALKQYGDSVATASVTADSAARHYVDSTQAVIAALEQRKARIVKVAVENGAVADSLDAALVKAATLADSNAVLTAEVGALRAERTNLWHAIAVADSATRTALHGRDSLQTSLDAATASVIALNARVQAQGSRAPKWLRVGFGVAKLGAVAYGGYELGRASK